MTKVLAIDHVQIAMPAGREAEARRFYGDVLGIGEVAKPEVLAGRGGCWFEHGDLRIHLGVETDFRPARKAHVAFAVADVPAMRAKVMAAGLPVRDDDADIGLPRVFTEDFFGNRIELVGAPKGGTLVVSNCGSAARRS